jgi:carotenoid cleavage dioxygenase-like enzyme
MMHDFAASKRHSILIDCPLSLDPKNLMRGKPVVHYSPNTATRFGVLPRHRPDQVRWFAHDSCIIFHTANAWDEPDRDAVSLVCCRMNSSALVYAAGNMAAPPSAEPVEEVCQLYFYEFHLSAADPTPAAAFPLSVIPMEFPEVSRHTFLRKARYVYGCSMGEGTFGASLGKAARMDCIVKMDVLALSERGQQRGEAGENETVDRRSVGEVLASARPRGDFAVDPDSIRVFQFPPLHHGQEVSFVPRAKQRGEDDGYLLTLVFDDGQLLPSGEAPPSAISELWVIDAWDMKTVVAKVHLPQRGEPLVPFPETFADYGGSPDRSARGVVLRR